VSLHLTDISGIAPESVKVRVSERGTLSNGWCLFGGCEDTGWIMLDESGSNIFGKQINISALGINGNGKYNFEAYACDKHYKPCENSACESGLGYSIKNTRNDMHCTSIADSTIETD
jgi:hypothetical protein